MSLRDLEKELVGEKHWTLKGEVRGKERELNSLLEADELDVAFSEKFGQSASLSLNGETFDDPEQIEQAVLALVRQRIKLKLFDNWDDGATAAPSAAPAHGDEAAPELGAPTKSLVEEYSAKYVISETGKVDEVAQLEQKARKLFDEVKEQLATLALSG